MSVAYAYSVVKYRDPNTLQVRVFKPGQPLDGVPRDVVVKLLKRGAAATYDRTKSQSEQAQEAQKHIETLEDRVKDLEAQLAQKTKQEPPTQTGDTASATPTVATTSASSSSQSPSKGPATTKTATNTQ